MADRKYMVDLPDPSRPGAFHSKGPLSAAEALSYLWQWFPDAEEDVLCPLFLTEVNQEGDEAPAAGLVLPSPSVSELEAPRYRHDCTTCVYEGRFGRYDAYYCAAGDTPHNTVVLRYGDEGSQYKSRPRFIHEKDPEGFAEAAAYTAVFAKHPRAEGAR